MRVIRTLLLVVVTAMLTNCVMITSSPVTANSLINTDKGPRIVTFLTPTPYIADMSVALAENGFLIKPMLSRQEITELQGSSRVVKYNEATARWGITLQTQHSGMTCAFTDFNIHHFTLMLTDIYTNQVVLVLKQKGSDGPCSTVKPVFEPLAEALAQNWQ
ncbi:MAG: hypothetical protein COB49_13045 [Alphaproteobacteria bacterium]|nr:MAG: hypothetical protein COB49_13045 [Alphaproteobacteria bacterium]